MSDLDEIQRLRDRVAMLEALWCSIHLYIDNWDWVMENRAALGTIPNWRCPYGEGDKADEAA